MGNPISHSKSPAIHRAALEAAGIAGSYEARQVDSEGVEAAFAEVREGALSGFNVTMPHKELAAGLCDRLDPDASRALSVNTVTLIKGEVWGFSTDVGNIRDSWGQLPVTGPILVLGAGGAAAAALVALSGRALYLAARRFGSGGALASKLQAGGMTLNLGEVRWDVPVIGSVVVNCTPLGMQDEPLPHDVLSASRGLFDMAYGPDVTPAVSEVRSLGLPAVEGIDLLVAQAARSFQIWTGKAPSIDVMRKAAKNS